MVGAAALSALFSSGIAEAQDARGTPAPKAQALAPKAETVERDTPKPEPAPKAHDITHATVIVEPRIGIANRHFDYSDRITRGLRSYDLGAAPRVGVSAEVYPLVPYVDGPLAGIGISGDYTTALGLSSDQGSGGNVDTSWTSFDLALRYRYAFGQGAMIGGRLGYGGVDFSFASNPDALAQGVDTSLPSVGYRFVRAGIDGRIPFWKLAALGGLDYLFVSSNEPLDARFPRQSVSGIEARLAVAFPFTSYAEARTGIAYQRFSSNLNSEPTDANRAGGATDRMARWETSVAFSF